MSGIDKSRFVDLRPQDEDEFTCGICRGIINKPVVVVCCRQTYCSDCIYEWVDTNNTCPNDRTAINRNDLSEAPIIIRNLLLKLKINCDYESEGCQLICLLEELDKHRKECQFNPNRKCKDCGGMKENENEDNVDATQHNCLQNLYLMIKSIGESVRDFQTLKNEIQELRQNEEFYRTTIESLSESLANLMVDMDKIKRKIRDDRQSRFRPGIP